MPTPLLALRRAALLGLLVCAAAGCATTRPSDPTADADALADALAAEGVRLDVAGVEHSPILAGRGTAFRERDSGDVLRVFVYDDADTPAQHADALALAGAAEQPSVYQRNRVVVAHYGGGALLAHNLRKVLGRPRF